MSRVKHSVWWGEEWKCGAQVTAQDEYFFRNGVDLAEGSNTVSVVATDASSNTTTKSFTVTAATGDTLALTYDSNGNLVEKVIEPGGAGEETWSYGWDGINRLRWVANGEVDGDGDGLVDGTERKLFTYDGYDRRVKWEEQTFSTSTDTWTTNTGSGAVRNFLWCGTTICQQRDTSNNRWKHFYADGEHDVTGGGGGTKRFYTRDHLGSIRETVDTAGDVVNRYDYSPYGVRETMAGGTEECLFGFTGHAFDGFSGLHLALYRGYDAELGRWVSRDPIGERGGLNLYGYVTNSPISAFDSLGLATTLIDTGPIISTGAGSSGGCYEELCESFDQFGSSNSGFQEAGGYWGPFIIWLLSNIADITDGQPGVGDGPSGKPVPTAPAGPRSPAPEIPKTPQPPGTEGPKTPGTTEPVSTPKKPNWLMRLLKGIGRGFPLIMPSEDLLFPPTDDTMAFSLKGSNSNYV